MGGQQWPPPVLAGRYELTDQLGQGGMGMVWAAQDHVLNRVVAVKLIRVDSGDPQASARFVREAHAAAGLTHPNIVTIYDFGIDNDVAFMVMENLPGPNLGALSKRAGPLPIDTCLRLIGETASGLSVAHRAGIVHRDIKPANLMLSATNSVKILDFGIAALADAGEQLTMAGQLAGTLSYLAPERAMGAPATVQSDLYALGCVAVALLTGRPVFEGTTSGMVLAHLNQAPRLGERFPWIPADVVDFVERLLEKDPARRPASAAAVASRAEALRHRLADAPSADPGRGHHSPPTAAVAPVPRPAASAPQSPLTSGQQHRPPAPQSPVTSGQQSQPSLPQQPSPQPPYLQQLPTPVFITAAPWTPPPRRSRAPLVAAIAVGVVAVAVLALALPMLLRPTGTPTTPAASTVTNTVVAVQPGQPASSGAKSLPASGYVTVLESLDHTEWTVAEVREIVDGLPPSSHRLVLDSSATPGMNPGYYAIVDGPYASQAEADAVCSAIGRVVGPHCYGKPVTFGGNSLVTLPVAPESPESVCQQRAQGFVGCPGAVGFLAKYGLASPTLGPATVGDWWAEPASYYGSQLTLAQLGVELSKRTASGRIYYQGHLLRYSEAANGTINATLLVPYRANASYSLDLARVDYVLVAGSGANPYRIVKVQDE